jgi:hypothetical protein
MLDNTISISEIINALGAWSKIKCLRRRLKKIEPPALF